MTADLSTWDDVRPASAGRPQAWGRRLGALVLLVIVVLGAFGILGVHSRTVTTSGGGWTMSVTYPQVARAGLDVPWRVRIHHPGGFPKQIELDVTADYFRMFETQGFFPDADSVTSNGKLVQFTFNAPDKGDDFVVDYDAYIQPSAQIGKSATVQLVVGGTTLASTSLHTRLLP